MAETNKILFVVISIINLRRFKQMELIKGNILKQMYKKKWNCRSKLIFGCLPGEIIILSRSEFVKTYGAKNWSEEVYQKYLLIMKRKWLGEPEPEFIMREY
jgi:hypothetical protein